LRRDFSQGGKSIGNLPGLGAVSHVGIACHNGKFQGFLSLTLGQDTHANYHSTLVFASGRETRWE
jgi:hypothetical protein